MKENIIQEKSFSFAIRIVQLCRFLREELREYDLARQVIRSGTSIGANVEEAIAGASRRDFLNKLHIARKEARETLYWLRLLVASETVKQSRLDQLSSDCEEIIRILTSIILTSQQHVAEYGLEYGESNSSSEISN